MVFFFLCFVDVAHMILECWMMCYIYIAAAMFLVQLLILSCRTISTVRNLTYAFEHAHSLFTMALLMALGYALLWPFILFNAIKVRYRKTFIV